ncbi:MAG: hypothetical protein AB2404_04300 [Planifilum fimeticola]|jgi:hypothetical protein
MEWVLWGMALYGSLWLLLVAFARTMLLRFEPAGTHLVVVTRNSQGCVEWVVRSFFFWSWLSGRSCQIICLDTGSSDDTLIILKRLKHRYPWIRIRSVREHQLADRMAEEGVDAERVVVMDLRNRQYGWEIPFDLHG